MKSETINFAGIDLIVNYEFTPGEDETNTPDNYKIFTVHIEDTGWDVTSEMYGDQEYIIIERLKEIR